MASNDVSRGSLIVAASIFTLAGVLAVRPLQSAAPGVAAADTPAAIAGAVAAGESDARLGESDARTTIPVAHVARPPASRGVVAPAVYEASAHAPAQVVLLPAPAAAPAPRATAPRVAHDEPRTWQKRAVVIGGSSGAGAAIGALIGGKKGALIGAAVGGGGGTLYEVLRKR